VTTVDDALGSLRGCGDALADDAVAAYFAEVATADPAALFGHLVRHVHLPAEDQVPAIRGYLTEAARMPEWVDGAQVDRGQQFFNRLVAHHFSALYLSSLPNSYAAAKGVQVLHLTGRLLTDTQRRLNETAQLLMDIAAPRSLDAGGLGIDRLLHVRLMHAAVRWLIAHDPSVAKVDDVDPPLQNADRFMWSASWGTPVNQEDLLGTWLTFTAVVYDAFDASGVDFDAQDVEGHLHMWRLVAHFLGLRPDLVPHRRDDADALRRQIFATQQRPCAAGKAMTSALVAQSRTRLPRFAWPIMPTAFRHFLGNEVADMIGIAPANWTRHLFPLMTLFSRVATRGKERHRLHARFSAFIGRRLMNGLLEEMRGGDRPAFAIPTQLAR
jgi:hypothetical protein